MIKFFRSLCLALLLMGGISACADNQPEVANDVADDIIASALETLSVQEAAITSEQAPEATATLPGPAVAVTDPPTLTPSVTPTPSLTPEPSLTPTITPEPPAFKWLDLLNAYRQASGLDPVGYSFELSADALAHAEYMGRNDDPSARSQNVGAPYYTPNGSQAGLQSLIFAIDSSNGTDLWAFDFWMSAPFQAITLLDPELKTIGYGRFRDDFGSVKIAYVVDTLSGIEAGSAPNVEYPIFYPPDGGRSYFTAQGFVEYPEPTSGCQGYEKTVGPVLMVQLGDGSATPDVKSHRITVDGTEIESCRFDETSFSSSLLEEQNAGREILNQRDAVVLIPRQPIPSGSTVEATVTTADESYQWSYDVVEQPFQPFDAITRSAPDWTVGDSVTTLGSVDISGFNYGGQTHDLTAPDRMKQAGMTWVKFQLKWRSDSVPSEINDKIARAKGAGFKVLVSVTGDPYPTSIDYGAFTRFMGGLASQSPAPDAIEVWNEMNIDFEWPAGEINPATYTREMLVPAYNAIKAANPNIMVISGAPAPTGFDNGTNAWAHSRYLNGLIEAGADQYLDCIGMHFNEGATPPLISSGHPAGEYFGWYYIPSLQNTFFAFGAEKPVCITELGFLSGAGYGGVPDRFWWAADTSVNEQAQWLYDALGIAYQSGYVDLAIVFNVDIFHYEADPQGGFAIIRPGGACPFCDLVAR